MKYCQNDYLDPPHGNSSVWRYMAHWKLESLINNSELFFPNATKLSDKYEVSIPESTLKTKRKELRNSGYSGKALKEELAKFHWETNPMKDLVLVNCWSISPHESYALWKIYLGNENNGVAIKSTVGKLKDSIQSGSDPYPENFYIGSVKYETHLKPDELSRFSVITTKKPFYDFEKELRLFIINYPLSEGGTEPLYDIHDGRTVKVDLQTLVHHIYISPFADHSYRREVGTLLKKSDINMSILKQSKIMDK